MGRCLCSPHHTTPHHTTPHHTTPHHTTPHHTTPHHTTPHHTTPHHTTPHHTTPHHTTPHHTTPLVTWHQSKNPQDGSCGTDCPHALPRSKPVVIRLDFSCVFPVSGRAHPARQLSRTPPWARHAVLWGTDAHTCPPPDRQTPAWRLPQQLCADMARAQWQGTIVAPRTYPCAVVARPSGQSAVVARPSWQSAAVAPPKQSSANVAPLQWQHTTVVQPPWRSVRGTAPSWHCPASPMPPWRQFSGRAPSWCRQRTRAPSWRNPHGRTPPRRCPDSPAPTWRQFSDVAPPWCGQRTRAPSWRNLQGRAPPWRSPNSLRAPAWPWCVLQANTRGTMARSAPGAPPTPVTPRAEVTCHRRYSPPHVPLTNVAVSLGHHRGAIFSVTCRLGTRIVGLVVWAWPLRPGVVGDLHGGAPPWCYGRDARPALTEPGGTQATGGARDRVA